MSQQPPPRDAFGQQDPRQGQGQYPPQQPPYPYDQQQPYAQGQPPYGQQQYPPPQGGTQPGWQPPYQGQPYPRQQGWPPPGPAGPPPRRPRRGGHLVRNILSGIGAVVVAGIAISALSSHGDGVSTTPSGNTEATGVTASPAAPRIAKAGSYFDVQDGSGDTYRVTLVKVVDPARGVDEFSTADSGKRFVAAVFRIKALKGSPQDEDANNDAVILGGNGQNYTADFDDIAGYTNFADGVIHVAQGDTVTGAVNFQVPHSVKVTKVQWSPGMFGSTVQWSVRR